MVVSHVSTLTFTRVEKSVFQSSGELLLDWLTSFECGADLVLALGTESGARNGLQLKDWNPSYSQFRVSCQQIPTKMNPALKMPVPELTKSHMLTPQRYFRPRTCESVDLDLPLMASLRA